MSKDRNWHEDGLCNGHPDPDLWHYENSSWDDEKELQAYRSVEAIGICYECPVRKQCLAQGMEDENIHSAHGGAGSIWGGHLTSERAIKAGFGFGHNAVTMEKRHARRVRQLLGKLVR